MSLTTARCLPFSSCESFLPIYLSRLSYWLVLSILLYRNSGLREMSSNDRHDHHQDHDQSGGHGHRHGPRHSHAPASFGSAFAISAILNIALVIAQVIFGVIANSVALLADAGHNFGDVVGILLAWAGFGESQWRACSR